MNKRLSLITVVTLASGCASSRTFFDHVEHREAYQLKESEVANLQFYIYNGIELSRVLGESETGVAPNHRLVTRDGQRTEIVLFPHGIPGIATKVLTRSIAIKFEELQTSDGEATLLFEVPPSGSRNPHMMMVEDSTRSVRRGAPGEPLGGGGPGIYPYYCFYGRTVLYAGKEYTIAILVHDHGATSFGDCAALQIRSDAFRERREESRKVPGVKFPDA
jgi:hypothetical protein